MRLGYRKQTNSHEEAIHHLIGMKTSSFAYLLFQKLLCNPTLSLVLTKSSSVLSTRIFSCQFKFTVYCTQNSGRLNLVTMNIYHVFSRWKSGSTGPRKSMYDTRPSLGACVEGVVWGRD